MRLVIMIVLLIVLIGGGAGAAYMYFGSKQAVASTGDAHVEKAKHDSGGHDGHGSDIEFVEISPLIFPLIDRNGAHQMVSLVISIEVSDAKGAENITHLSPRLNDAYIQDLYGFISYNARAHDGIIQVSEVKARLKKVTAGVIGEEGFSDVLLQVVQQRPI